MDLSTGIGLPAVPGALRSPARARVDGMGGEPTRRPCSQPLMAESLFSFNGPSTIHPPSIHQWKSINSYEYVSRAGAL